MCWKKRYLFTGIVFLGMVIMLTGWLEQAPAQEKYPSKPIDIIVTLGPGGAVDLGARLIAGHMSKQWGIPINVVNKPGGLKIVACLYVDKAKPDGYTLLQDNMSGSSLMITVKQDLPFDVLSRTYIGLYGTAPFVFFVRPDSPVKSMKDLSAEAKKDPGNFTWTSTGGAPSLIMRKFFKAIGVDITKTKPVTHTGGAGMMKLTVSGMVKVGLGSTSATLPSIEAKLVRPLAVTDEKRQPKLPDVPTTAEAGYPAVSVRERFGLSGPPNLPSDIVEVWEKALKEMLKDPEFIVKLERIGMDPFYLNASDTRKLVVKEIEEIKELWGLK